MLKNVICLASLCFYFPPIFSGKMVNIEVQEKSYAAMPGNSSDKNQLELHNFEITKEKV